MAKIDPDKAQPPITVEWIGGPDDGLTFYIPFGSKSCLAERAGQRWRVPISRGMRGQPTARWSDRREVPSVDAE